MPAILTPDRTEARATAQQDPQWRVWQSRLSDALRQSGGSEDGALLGFTDNMRGAWAQEGKEVLERIQRDDPAYYNRELARVSRYLGANTIDANSPDGEVSNEAEFITAVSWLVKRMTDDPIVATGQRPTANSIRSNNQPDFALAKAEAATGNVLSDEEKAALAEAKTLYGDNKNYTHLMQHIDYAMREGFSPEEAKLYIGARIEEDSIASGRGSPEMAASLMRQLQERQNDSYARPRYAPALADTQ
jgi:hypothetical protein